MKHSKKYLDFLGSFLVFRYYMMRKIIICHYNMHFYYMNMKVMRNKLINI